MCQTGASTRKTKRGRKDDEEGRGCTVGSVARKALPENALSVFIKHSTAPNMGWTLSQLLTNISSLNFHTDAMREVLKKSHSTDGKQKMKKLSQFPQLVGGRAEI